MGIQTFDNIEIRDDLEPKIYGALGFETNNLFIPNKKTFSLGGTGAAELKDGCIYLSGTPNNGVTRLSDNITLQAGTYYFGSFDRVDVNACQIQIIDANANVAIDFTATHKAVTLDGTKDVYIRLRHYGSNADGVVAKIMLVADEWPSFYYPHYVANDFIARNRLSKAMFTGESTTQTDLNEYTESGMTTLASNYNYTNLPTGVTNGAKHVLVLNTNKGYVVQRLYVITDSVISTYDEYVRVYSGDAWKQWRKVYSMTEFDALQNADADNTVFEYTNDTFSGSVDNDGINLRILSYNVAKYNNDTEVYISDEKRFNIKKMLCDVEPDIIGLQEDGEIDGENKSSSAYIYAPIFPFVYGTGSCTIHSKIEATRNLGVMEYSNGRFIRAAVFTIDNKTILFVSTHPVANYNSTGISSSESIAARLIQYDEMFKWIHGEIQLKIIGSETYQTCPSWDYCIITGDMNSITGTDRSNLKALATARSFTMASGGWLGWLETANNKSIDNIICSEDVTINSVKSYKSLYDDLYSDHYPIAASITLHN